MAGPEVGELAERMRAHPGIARAGASLDGVPGCWLVGGAVRDLLLGAQPLDLDVVVEGDALSAADEAARRLEGRVRRHERFGTATVEAGELRFDLVTARSESYPVAGGLPDVRAARLEQDLARRDFTVNALAARLEPSRMGELKAAPHGLDDLAARRLRVLHDRSFVDDPTRLLRLVRYGTRLGFDDEPATAALAAQAVEAGAPRTVSGARIGGELMALVGERSALEALARVRDMGLDRALHPDLRVDLDLAGRALSQLTAHARLDLVLLASAATGFDRGALRAWLESLELAAAERDAVIAAALDAAALGQQLLGARRPSQVAALARGRPPEQLALAAAQGAADPVRAWDQRLRGVELEISGTDLIAAGIAEGPILGRALAAALERKLDGEIAGRDQELAAALEAAGA